MENTLCPSVDRVEGAVVSGSADEFVNRMSTLQMVADHQNEILEAAAVASVAAAQAQAQAQVLAAEAQAQYDAVAAQQAALEGQIAEYQTLYDRLSLEEQASQSASAGVSAPKGRP